MNAHIRRLIDRYPVLKSCAVPIHEALELLEGSFVAGGKLLLCGNGGSASDCEHIAGELMKSFLIPRPISGECRKALERDGETGRIVAEHLQGGLPCVALTGHPALNMAISNDIRGDMAFAQQTHALGRPGDTLWGISTSGNSANVVHAFHVARAREIHTLALTGESGGKLKGLASVAIQVPASTVVEIQELHLPVYHTLCAALEERFFGR
jgi:D-sedoheptulose 7-phosphate isomerase